MNPYDILFTLRNSSSAEVFDRIVEANGMTYKSLTTFTVNKHRKLEITFNDVAYTSYIHNDLLADKFLSPADRLERKYS